MTCRDDLPSYPHDIEDFDDLCEAFRWASEQGFVNAISDGPHAVGTTLEEMLNHDLDADPSRDFGFTELKAQRSETSSPTTLFTKEPTYFEGWSMRRILEEHGYRDPDDLIALRINLYEYDHYGLYLDSDEDSLTLISTEFGEIGYWSEDSLEDGLYKISDLCYISADCRAGECGEQFHYNSFNRLTLPEINGPDFLSLIEDGSITIELRAYIREDGTVRNHGTAFRTRDIMSISLYDWEELTD